MMIIGTMSCIVVKRFIQTPYMDTSFNSINGAGNMAIFMIMDMSET